jgi:hypothetical protein
MMTKALKIHEQGLDTALEWLWQNQISWALQQ